MKKARVLSLLGALALTMSLLTACGRNTASNAGTASNPAPVADGTSGSTQNNSAVITEDKAKQIALNDAKIAESDLTDIRVWLENDDGRQEYHVEFRKDGIEYDYEIDVESGTILSLDRDDETSKGNDTTGESTGNVISVADAKKTALKHAGLSESDVTRLTAQLEKDDGRDVYEVEFYKGGTEYDYHIDAKTGDILDYHVDAD